MQQNDSVSEADRLLAAALKSWSARLKEAGLLQKDQARLLHSAEEKYSKYLGGKLRIVDPGQFTAAFLALVAERLGQEEAQAARAELTPLARAAHAGRPLAWVADALTQLRSELEGVRDDRAAAEVQQRLEAVAADLARAETMLAGHEKQLTELRALRQEADRLRTHAVNIRYRAGRDINAPVTYYNGDGSGPGRRITPARAAGGIILAMAIVAGAIVGYRWYGDRTAAQSVAAQRHAEKTVDAQTVPFQVVVEGPDQRRVSRWAFALDQELTKAQEKALAPFKPEDLAAVQSYLAKLHPRLLPSADVPAVDVDTKNPGLKALLRRETGNEGMVGGETYRLHFTTDRSSSVTIENIGVTDISCEPSTAVSSVYSPPAGEEPVPGIFLSLADPPGTPAVEVDDQGEAVNADYFAHHTLDLRQTTTPGDIQLHVGGVEGQLCSWRFQVDYLTADGNRLSEKVDNHSQPFTVESLPHRLKQLVEYDLGGATDPAHWTDCAVEPTVCAPVASGSVRSDMGSSLPGAGY